MKILSIECSAGPASAAIIEDRKVIGSSFVNVKLTHSQTLMPMIESLLKSCATDISEISGIAVSAGPGSFTGVRIGISAAKGIAAPDDLPCVAVSALDSMAEVFRGHHCVLCAVMDARCGQFYNSIYKIEGNRIHKFVPDRAIMHGELIEEIKDIDAEKIIVCGDGAELFMNFAKDIDNIEIANPTLRFQNAIGTALCAYDKFISNDTISCNNLLPIYLRLPQSERELKAKMLLINKEN